MKKILSVFLLIFTLSIGFAQNFDCGSNNPGGNKSNGVGCGDWWHYAPVVASHTPIKNV